MLLLLQYLHLYLHLYLYLYLYLYQVQPSINTDIHTDTDRLQYLYLYSYLYQVHSSSKVFHTATSTPSIGRLPFVLVLVPVQLSLTSSGTNTSGNNTGNDFDPFDVPGSGDNDENFDAIEATSTDRSSADIDFLPKIFILYYLVNGTAIHNLITATLLGLNPSMRSDSYDNNTVYATTAFPLLIMNGNDVDVITTAYSSKNEFIFKECNHSWSDDASVATFLSNHGENNIILMLIASKSSWDFEVRIIMNPKVFIEICTGTSRHKLQMSTSLRTRTGTYFVAMNNDDEMLGANYGKNNVHHHDAFILTLEITMHIESAKGANSMGSNDTTFECFYALGLHRLFGTHLSRDHGENQKNVTAPEMNWNNERRIMSCNNNERQITSCNNNFIILSPHYKMFSYTRNYQLLQANNQNVLTSTFISNHPLTHLKDSAFLFMGSINNGNDDNNKDSQNEDRLFLPWMIGDKPFESTRIFESLRCEVDYLRDVRDVRMGSILEPSLIKSLEDDIIGEDATLKDEQLDNYKILPDLCASLMKLQSADISNSDDIPVVRIKKLYLIMSRIYCERTGWPDKDNPGNTTSDMASTDDNDPSDESAYPCDPLPSSNINFNLPSELYDEPGTAAPYRYDRK